MPDISTIVVPDAATTPVNHTFNKVKVVGDSAYFVEQSNTSALGYWTLVLNNRAPLAGQQEKLYRSKLNLAIPVVVSETINGIARPILEYVSRYNCEAVIPAAATLQNRKDIRKIAVGLQNDASWVAMTETQLNVT